MAEEIEDFDQQGDPFKEFGGAAVTKSTGKAKDPFAEFGGSVVSGEKKNSGGIVGTLESSPSGLPLPSQGGNLPDFQKGLALAQKGYAMPSEGGEQKQDNEGSLWNIGQNLRQKTVEKAADIDVAALKFLRNLSGKLPFANKPEDIYDENGNLTKYGQNIESSDFLGKAIKSFKETQNKEKELQQTVGKLPKTTAGQIAGGLTSIAPDLALAAMTGGKNLFSGTGTLAAIGNAVTSSFVREQAIAGAAKGYNESDNKGVGETFLNTIKEGGKSAGQGALYELAGFGGNKLGGVIGGALGGVIGGALKNTTVKEAINLGARLVTFSLGVPNVESLIKEGKLASQDEVLQNLGVAGAMELFHLAGKAPEALMKGKAAPVSAESNPDIEAKVANHINDVRAGSALNNFMKASPDVIDNLVKSDQTAQHLNLSAMDAVKRAESMPDGEEKSKVLQTAADFTQAADIKHVTDLIANSPNGLTHLAQDLPENIRDQFMQKAQDIHKNLNPTELRKQAHVDNISQAEDAIKQFEPLANPNNPNVKERLEAQREIDKAKATIDQATKDFNKTSDEQEQQKQALQDVKLAQQQEAYIEPTEEVKPTEIKEEIKLAPIEFSKTIEDKYGITVDLTGNVEKGDLTLSRIEVPKEERGKEIGTKAMEDIIKYADENNKRIVLTPSTDFGGTSVKRLKDFYKNFGFIENTGKNKDFTTKETMYRNPEVKPTEGKEEVKSEEEKHINKLTQDDLKKAEAKFAAAKDKFEKAKAKIEATQVTQRGMFGGEQKGMFSMGGEEAKNTLDPLRIATKEAKAELDDIRNKIKVQEEAQQELKPVEKKQKPFVNSQGHSVELENGKLVVKDKKGEVLSNRASKKAIEEYADNFDYSKGEKAPEIPNEITNSRDAAKYVIDESNNPEEVAQVYASEDLIPKEGNVKFQAIKEYGLGRIKTSSYTKRFGDINKVEKSMYLKIFSEERGQTIDQIAKEISDHYEGLNIEPQDIVDYIEKYSRGDKAALEYEESDVAKQARDKFNKLTGLDLNPELADKIINKQLEKATKDQLDIIKEDYETAKQLEDAYWAEYEKTDGFTKESPVSKVNEPKTAPKEKVTEESIVEEPEGTTSIKNKTTAEERANKGLDEIEVAAKRSFPEVFEKGKQLVDEGKIDPRQMAIDLAKKPRALSPEESVALLYDRMKIQKEYKKLSEDIESEPDGIVKDLMRSNLNQLEKAALINDEAAKKTGYEQGLGLAVRKMIIKEDYSLLNQKARYKAANNGEELSPEIESKLKENVTKLEEAQKKLEEYEQTIKDLQAKKAIDTEAKKAKKTNKTTEDFKKEREYIFKNIKDKWDSASKTNIVTAVPVPYAAQLAAISPEVLKLVRSYAEQGITKLDDIVNDLHENISKQIPDITKRDVKDILAGEYTKKKEAPPVDREKMKLQSNVNRIKNQIELDKQEILRDKRSLLRKGIDYFQGWRRFGLLSGAPVIGKIGLGAAIRTGITTPGEALIGKGLSQLPIISRIAAKAGREGTINTKAEAKAFAQFVDKASYEDVRQVFKTGRGELENLHDKKLYPSNGWLDFFGNLHAAIKVLPKRAEYFRALEYRTEHALKNGADITDPIVQQELSAKAYADALRSIYMQDNAVTDLYKTAVRKLESLGGIGKGGAEVMKFILPIIKVPTNYVAEESSYILGGFKALFALRKGISKLSPEEADYVMRALKKQTAGVGFLMLGYARPDLVGGYYTGPRKKGDLQAGDLVVAGVHMPHWAMHTPMLEALQFGASIRRAREAAGKSYKQKDLNMFTGIVPSLGAVAKQIPFAEQAEQVTKGLKSTDAFLRYAGGQAQSVLDPQLVKNIAEFTDYSNGQWNKREAKTFMEKLQSGFPGTREQLKIKKQ